jgi:clan AA aspartic protease
MGDIYLALTVANLHDLERQRIIRFLVDTGATRAWLPQDMAEALGIEPTGSREVELAAGSVKTYPTGACWLDFGGERESANVIIDPPGSEPMVGTHVLQAFRLVIDRHTHTISRSRALRAK